MIDLHPVLSGLPLASVLLLLGAEALVCFPRAAAARDTLRHTAVLCCLLAAIGAFLSGYQASSLATQLQSHAEDAMANHHTLGRFLLINSILLVTFFYLMKIAVHGKRVMQSLYYVAFVTQIVLTVWVGFLGGQLVFEHGINVKSSSITLSR
jgi:uncharacterized membrane protein